MNLDDLRQYGIPEQLISTWRARQGDTLLPVQRQAICRGLLKSVKEPQPARNLVIVAPTSTGKSFCAELAAASALLERRKVVMLFPLKSLAEQKYRELHSCYGPLGLDCLVATGDHPENDNRFLAGDFHLAVSIPEKFDLLLTARLDALRTIALLVVDELQTIAEPKRGAVLELLLTKLLASSYHPRLLALSAVTDHETAQRVADWLRADLVEEYSRPVELERGVAADGTVRLKAFNSGREFAEPFLKREADEESFMSFVRHLKESEGSTLVFMKSRRDTVDAAFRLASVSSWPAAKQALESLADEEPSFLTRSLQQALARGVAFHNADLSPSQRAAVEEGFVNREIKTLFATTTLALGVNLPADTVYLETVKYQSGRYDDRPELTPISRAEFDNMTGRAGRLGYGSDRPGRAIILAESEFDREILWRSYLATNSAESFGSAMESMPIEDIILSLITCGLAATADDITRVLARSFWFQSGNQQPLNLDTVLQLLCERELLTQDGAGRFATSPAGRAAALGGLTCAQAEYCAQTLKRQLPQTAFGWIFAALSAPDWEIPAGILSRSEQRSNAAIKMLYERFDYSVEEVEAMLPADHRRVPLPRRQAAILKISLALEDWRNLQPLQTLEERFQMHVGQIIALAETAAHLLAGLSQMASSHDYENPIRLLLDEYRFSVAAGLPPEMRDLYERFGNILSRSDFGKLYRRGLTDSGTVSELADTELAGLVPNDHKRKLLTKRINQLKQEVTMKPVASLAGRSFSSLPDQIEIDGAYEGDRYLVRINGLPVRLTGKSFKYLAKLAWSRMSHENGWVYKEDLEIGFNQARYLYRLKNEIAASYPSEWQIIENNRLGYYRLDLRPDRIKMNPDNLRSFPDFELQQIADRLRTKPNSGDHSLPC